jgi:endoglucanase
VIIFLSAIVCNIYPADSTIVDKYGQLRIEGTKIVNKDGQSITLRGMSLFWSQWDGSRFYNYDCIKWLRDDWKCTVVRASMGIEGGGYLTNPAIEKNKIKAVIEAAIDLGVYVLVDWHDHHAHEHESEAIEFFKEIAELYGNTPNIIYEIYNEPEQVSWSDIVKPYSESVVTGIRTIDPDNIIVVGNPTWSQDVDVASNDPIDDDNVVYALHYYAASHKQFLRNKAQTALNNGVALFVTEFGTCEYTGNGFIDYDESNTWFDFLEENQISWCNWSICDKNESASALKSGVSSTGNWSLEDLRESGIFIRDKIISLNSVVTGIDDKQGLEEIPDEILLKQNYPNPFNPATTIKYQIPYVETAYMSSLHKVILKVYDILGNEIATLVNEHKQPGEYSVELNAENLPSGVYPYTLRSGNFIATKKMILLK